MIFLLNFVFFWISPAWAASCCGGSFSFPALILGDDKIQLTSTYSRAEVTDEVLTNGKWLKRTDGNQSQTLKLEGATLLSDRWQTGLSVPLTSKDTDSSSTQRGLGDVSIYLGHETFQELTYSRWKPRGVTFLQLTAPTAPSIYDSNSPTEIRGRGFYSLGAGVALMKAWKVWDMNFTAEFHHSFARTADGAAYNGTAQITPGWGASQNVGLGWNQGDLRLGTSLGFLHEAPIKISGSTASEGQQQKNFTLSFSGSYMLNMESAFTFSYSDQTLIGNPVNSSLSKTFNVSYQHRWPR